MFFRFLSDFLPETMFFIEDNDFFGNRDFSIYNGSYDIVIFKQRFNLVRMVPGIKSDSRKIADEDISEVYRAILLKIAGDEPYVL